MRKALFTSVLSLLLPLPALAQEYPRVEVFGGYSYFRANPEGYNLNGWNASIAGNISNWFGIVGDVSGHYGAPSQFGFRIPGVDISSYTFLAGPKLAYREGRVTAFAHFLIGDARAGTGAFGLSTSDNALAAAIGGGIDFKLNDWLAVRAIQADYVMTRFRTAPEEFGPERQNNARLSFGLVLQLGNR
jgi:hypothetical protein